MVFEQLTNCEQLVMKVAWDAAEELSLMDFVQRTKDNYDKDWAPQTVSTFLTRLIRKGYLEHYRQGRVFYYRILVSLEKYKAQLTHEYMEFWNHGNADEFLCALINERPLRPEEIKRIKALVAKARKTAVR